VAPELVWTIWRRENLLPLPGFKPQIIQPVASLYADSTITAPCVPLEVLLNVGNCIWPRAGPKLCPSGNVDGLVTLVQGVYINFLITVFILTIIVH